MAKKKEPLGFLVGLQEQIETIEKLVKKLESHEYQEDFMVMIVEYACIKEFGVTKTPSKPQIKRVMQGMASIEKHIYKSLDFDEEQVKGK